MPEYRMYVQNGAPGCVTRFSKDEFEAENDEAARKIFEEVNVHAEKKEAAHPTAFITRAGGLKRIDQREITTTII